MLNALPPAVTSLLALVSLNVDHPCLTRITYAACDMRQVYSQPSTLGASSVCASEVLVPITTALLHTTTMIPTMHSRASPIHLWRNWLTDRRLSRVNWP